ncbi:hypothetical protein [Luteimonas sp. 100069]|uniref:hypothetical protein n=1 Tax=Luteimonas sp. 100069 TaxID=2006109 RepID=UPI000F4D9871|nr:hypothetical protein [Luteimonas sp. 100069]
MRFSQMISIAGLFAAGAASAGDLQCPVVDQPPAAVCVASAHGLAYADTQEDAGTASRALAEAAQRYANLFGRAPVGMLVLSTSLDPVAAIDFANTHDLEFAQVWVPAKAKRAMTERAMRQAGLDRARINQALAGMSDQEPITLRHEVGHAMHAAMYWPGSTGTLQDRYGTPAPDWLDEAAAIAMEPIEAQGRHVAAFIDFAKRRPRDIPDLADFLASEHPVRSAGLAGALARGPKSDSGVQMMVASSGDRFPGMETFYGQSLLTALFLAETSGNPQILAPISRAIADGLGFDAWLARDGAEFKLPATVAALQPLWNDWLQQVLRRGGNSEP